MYQVGYLQRSKRDARSTKNKFMHTRLRFSSVAQELCCTPTAHLHRRQLPSQLLLVAALTGSSGGRSEWPCLTCIRNFKQTTISYFKKKAQSLILNKPQSLIINKPQSLIINKPQSLVLNKPQSLIQSASFILTV